jgi:hypothetical protein
MVNAQDRLNRAELLYAEHTTCMDQLQKAYPGETISEEDEQPYNEKYENCMDIYKEYEAAHAEYLKSY